MGEQLYLGVDALSLMNNWSADIQAAINHTVCLHNYKFIIIVITIVVY